MWTTQLAFGKKGKRERRRRMSKDIVRKRERAKKQNQTEKLQEKAKNPYIQAMPKGSKKTIKG